VAAIDTPIASGDLVAVCSVVRGYGKSQITQATIAQPSVTSEGQHAVTGCGSVESATLN